MAGPSRPWRGTVPGGFAQQVFRTSMLNIIARRLLVSIPTLILVSLLVFTLQKLLPGDPVLTLAGE